MTSIKLFQRVLKLANISFFEYLFLTLLLASVSILDVVAIGLVPAIIYSFSDKSQLPQFMQENIFFDFEYLLIYLVMIFVVKFIFITFTNKYVIEVGVEKQKNLMISLLKGYQNFSYTEYSNADPNILVSTLINVVTVFIDKMLYPFLKLIPDIIIFLAILGMLFFIDTAIPLILILAFGILSGCFFLLTGDKLAKWGKWSLDSLSSMYQVSRNSIEGFEEVKVSNTGNIFLDKLDLFAEKYKKAASNTQVLSMIPKQLLETSFIIVFVLMMFLMKALGISFEQVMPTAAAIAVASVRLLPLVVNITGNINLINFSKISVDQLENQLFSLKNKAKKITYINTANSINLENICFSYGESKLLEKINFKFKKEEIIGIIGASGSGKSTILRILLGMINPQSGNIFVNEKKLNPNQILSASLLSQQIFVINSTIEENVTFGEKTEFNQKRFDRALQMAGFFDFVQTLNEKEKTIVGDGGVTLSGGQSQRLALARIFYSTKDIVVFDEPTSSLDDKNAEIIFSSLQSFKKNKIVIVVTHDKKLSSLCDKVLSL